MIESVYYMNLEITLSLIIIKSLLFYMTGNMDFYLLIFQPSEFLYIYIIVITRLLTYPRSRF